MASNFTDLCEALKSLEMTEFSEITVEELTNLSDEAIQKYLDFINELDLEDLTYIEKCTLRRLVHLMSTKKNNVNYGKYFIHPKGNIRVMINEPEERSSIALYRSSRKTYDFSIGQKIDFGNRSFSESLEKATGYAKQFGGRTMFHISGEFLRINFKNDSMDADELEARIKRSTTGVVKQKWDDAGVQHYSVVIEEDPAKQIYDDNVTGTANAHNSVQ